MTTEPITDVTTAILEAAQKLGADGKGERGVRGYLEYIAMRHPDVFKIIMAKAREEKTNG
jgi:hypothetical protein